MNRILVLSAFIVFLVGGYWSVKAGEDQGASVVYRDRLATLLQQQACAEARAARIRAAKVRAGASHQQHPHAANHTETSKRGSSSQGDTTALATSCENTR